MSAETNNSSDVPQQSGFMAGFQAGKTDPMNAMIFNKVTESCPFKTVFSLGAGFVLGGVFGLFSEPLFSPAFRSFPLIHFINLLFSVKRGLESEHGGI